MFSKQPFTTKHINPHPYTTWLTVTLPTKNEKENWERTKKINKIDGIIRILELGKMALYGIQTHTQIYIVHKAYIFHIFISQFSVFGINDIKKHRASSFSCS